MTYKIVVVVLLALPPAVAAARLAVHYHRSHRHRRTRRRHGLEASLTREAGSAEASARARHPSSGLPIGGADSRTPRRTRTAKSRPVFNLGATPSPGRVIPWPSEEHIDEHSRDGTGPDRPDRPEHRDSPA